MTEKTFIDKLTDSILGKEIEKDTETGRLRAEGAGLVFSIYEAGSFVDDQGKTQAYQQGIKISVGPRSIRLEPSQVAVLKNILNMPDICAAVQLRIDEENELRKNLRM